MPARIPRRRDVFAAVLGNGLEFYDFGVYGLFAVLLSHAFFPSRNAYTGLLLTVATFGVGFVTRPLGAMVIGAYADRRGRRAAMTLTLGLMALGTGAVGLLPGYATIGPAAPLLLVLARLIQGFSAGGEMGPATTFLIEAAPAGRRARLGSWQLGSQWAAWIVSGSIGFVLTATLGAGAMASWGWRVPFLLGLLIAPVGLWMRAQLDETLDRAAAHRSGAAVLASLLRDRGGVLALVVLAIAGSTIAQYFIGYMTTYAVSTLHMGLGVSLLAAPVSGAVGTAFSVWGGMAADRFGRRTIVLGGRLLLVAALFPVFLWIAGARDGTAFLAGIAILTALHAASGAVILVLAAEAFPQAVRSAGLAIGYAVSVTLFGGTSQLVATFLLARTADPLSPVWYVAAANLVTVAAVLALPVKAARRAPAPAR